MSNKIELGGIFSEGYGIVPKKLMKAKDINANTKLILCYLLSYSGSGATAFPQIKDMAENLGLSKRTIIRSIKESQEMGYINKHQENRGDAIGKRNIYELIFMQNFAGDKLARATQSIASDKNDISLVTVGNPINNMINNNMNNNMGAKKFVKPSIEEVRAYANELKFNALIQQPLSFIDYYESKGWMIGKNRMKDWRAAMRTWHRNEKSKFAPPPTPPIRRVPSSQETRERQDAQKVEYAAADEISAALKQTGVRR